MDCNTYIKLAPLASCLFLASTVAQPVSSDRRDWLLNETGKVVNLDVPEIVYPGDPPQRVCLDSKTSAAYLRAKMQIDVVTDDSAQWYITVSDEDFQDKHTIPAALVVKGYWSPKIYSQCLMVQVPDDGATLKLTKLLFSITPTMPRSVFPEGNEPNYRSASDPKLKQVVREASRLVARLQWVKTNANNKGQEMEVTCTGFLLSSELLITNEHCISTQQEASGVTVELGYTQQDAPPDSTIYGAELLLSDKSHDYSIMKIPKVDNRPIRSMAWRDGPFHRRERLAIVHHPSGDPLSVSNDRLCFVATPKLTGRGPKESLSDFGHMCDADNGSSGGMVISDEAGCHQIIGLHHWGVGGEYKSGLQNQAVSIDAIYRDLQNKAKSREQQITKKLQENAQAVLSAVRLAKCTDLLAWRDNKTVTEE